MNTTATSPRFGAFRSYNFRLYFAGQLLSTVGTFMQSLAQGWLVLELTGRGDRLGITVALQFAPLLLFGLFTGVVADKVDNRRLLIATSAVSAVLAFAQALLVSRDGVTIWWIYGFALAFGLVNALERPAMQSIVFELAGAERLSSAVAINGTIQTTGRLLGPGIAGLIIAKWGTAPCFAINGVSFLMVIVALGLLRRAQMVSRALRKHTKGQLREGLRYVATHREVAQPLLIMFLVGLVSYNFQTTIPALVKFGFGREAGAVGAVQSVSAIGSVAGGYLIAGFSPTRRKLGLASMGFGAGLALMGIVLNYPLLLAIGIPTGMASAMFTSTNVAVVQRATPPEMQGRVMGLHQMAWQGTTPIGALMMGVVIDATSSRVPFYLGGATAIACGLYALGLRERRQATSIAAAAN